MSQDEISRSERHAFAADRQISLASRALLRKVLAQCLGIAPTSVLFDYSLYGKPLLLNSSELKFSVSHTRGLVAIAISIGSNIGVDVERVAQTAVSSVMQFFAPSEINDLTELPEHERPEAFYKLWTLKEAYVKAIGIGLSMPLNQFSFDITKPPQIYFQSDLDGSPDAWQFFSARTFGAYIWSMAINAPSSRACRPLIFEFG